MDLDQYFRFVMALLFVVALILAGGWLLRRAGMAGGAVRGRSRQRRLSVVEALPIDARRRLLLVRRDDREHLILLGANGDLLIDSAPAGGFDGALARTADPADAGSGPR
ncbi:flagellar biosynthetic protein FliO [Azospirillum picis]|uniref:Flagellar protein FliO/FliZ n=1 Tax=Azospirillum picis TaxID=488438 RepID=A0ABU0MUC9_9PROT|nr:flagellar biosynthetic protein FliO [Azospirillum picis]MBP2303026.1 flagellar protein FliO/FliZ [Azospirillum picis]MDQ0536778.1 flagellar protein FliO/FliZ [Azospirillum picis]